MNWEKILKNNSSPNSKRTQWWNFNSQQLLLSIVYAHASEYGKCFNYKFQKSAKKHQRTITSQIAWHSSWLFIIAFVVLATGRFLCNNNLADDWMSFDHWMLALIATFLRHFYGLAKSVFMVDIFLGYGNVLPRFCNYGMYQKLRKLSFSVFMCYVPCVCAGGIIRSLSGATIFSRTSPLLGGSP